MGAIIYGILDPRTSRLFYIGKTSQGRLPARLRDHRLAALRNQRRKSARIIRGLLALGIQPDAFILESVPESDWVEAEQFWIAYFRSIGCNLANHTMGGEGLSGMKHTPEAVAKMIAANIGRKKSAACKALIKASWTPERKASHLVRHKGKLISEDQRRLLSRVHSGKTISRAHREKISAFFKGRKQSEEQRQRSGDGVRTAWTPQRKIEQALRQKLRQASKTHCKRGHILDGENLYRKPDGRRVCKTCRLHRQRGTLA